MSEVILNMLPLTQEERQAFLDIAPGIEQLFFPLTPQGCPKGHRDPELLARVTVILGFPNPRAEALKAAVNLKWLQAWSAGVDPFLVPGILRDGAMLTNAVGAYGQSVSEHMLSMLLSLCKLLPQYRDARYQDSWLDLGPTKSLMGATVLVLGTGDLGSTFAGMCKALGAHTVGLKRTVGDPIPGFDQLSTLSQLDEWLPQADVVTLMLPHTPETIHIMNAHTLSLMKEDAILLSAGRGTAVDQDALVACLNTGKLWGVGLDVTDPEPLPGNHPLRDIDRVLITPHVAGGLFRLEITARRMAAIAQENLRRYLAGQPLKNRVR